jgi:hypothetical protein
MKRSSAMGGDRTSRLPPITENDLGCSLTRGRTPSSGRLLDIPGEHIAVFCLPKPPAVATIRRIDVIIRVDRDPAPAAD